MDVGHSLIRQAFVHIEFFSAFDLLCNRLKDAIWVLPSVYSYLRPNVSGLSISSLNGQMH